MKTRRECTLPGLGVQRMHAASKAREGQWTTGCIVGTLVASPEKNGCFASGYITDLCRLLRCQGSIINNDVLHIR